MSNKPECLYFEYEELTNPQGEVVAYRFFVLNEYSITKEKDTDKEYSDFDELVSEIAVNISSLYYGRYYIVDCDFKNHFIHYVERFNKENCKPPETDTSVLDGLIEWHDKKIRGAEHYRERHAFCDKVLEYKATLKPQYFKRKEK